MKLNPSSLFVGILLVVLVIVAVIQYRQFVNYRASTDAEIASLNNDVTELRQQLQAAESKIDQLEQRSIDGLVKQANGVIIDGWQVLMNTVEQELKKVQESLQIPDDPVNAPQKAGASEPGQPKSSSAE